MITRLPPSDPWWSGDQAARLESTIQEMRSTMSGSVVQTILLSFVKAIHIEEDEVGN